MENVICIGTVACRIGKKLQPYKNYKLFYVDDDAPPGKRSKDFILLPKQSSPDGYEEHFDPTNLASFLSKIKSSCTFIVCGASLVSAATLRIMELVFERSNKEVELLYIKPETALLSETKKMQERVVYNVMQQYARSGVLKRMLIISNENVATIIGEVPLVEHFEKVNEVIASTFHMTNVFDNTKSVVDTFSPLRPTSRIGTFCAFSPGSTKNENYFFNITALTEARFYYGIPSNTLKEDAGLYREVLEQMKKRVEIFSKVSYGIYETSYDTKIGYGVLYSNEIQE